MAIATVVTCFPFSISMQPTSIFISQKPKVKAIANANANASSPLVFHRTNSKPVFRTTISCSLVNPPRPEYIPNRIPDPKYVRVLDNTLLFREQSSDETLTPLKKLNIARQLAKLGVDIIAAGFPAASKEDFEAVKMIAKEVGKAVDESGYVPVICGLSRCKERDITAAWEAVKYAKRPRIHMFIATSGIRMMNELRKTKPEVVETARDMVKYARSLGCNDVQFSPEDASRSDKEFLYEILGEVIKAGATTLNITDTVGQSMNTEFHDLIKDIIENTPGMKNVVISTHCQNDLGHATANTIAGACAGARQVEVAINGVGEGAGNASLEEVVMIFKCRREEQTLGGLYTGINTKQILMTSKMVEEYTGLQVQPHKPIVGANAFVYVSGIIQDGILKHTGKCEIISPEDIGFEQSSETDVVFGKLSGRHALKCRLKELGYELDDEQLENIFWHFKAVAERKKRVTDDDIKALVSAEVFQPEEPWKLISMKVDCGNQVVSTATVILMGADGKKQEASAVGSGPVGSAFRAVDHIVKEPVTLLKFSTNNVVTEGSDAVVTSRVLIQRENNPTSTHASTGGTVQQTFSGTATDSDIVVSLVKAYIVALNKMLGFKDQ